MGVVYDCALCGVCEYNHDGAPHTFRWPDEHAMRLRTYDEVIKLLENDITKEYALWILKQWRGMETDKSCFAWKRGA